MINRPVNIHDRSTIMGGLLNRVQMINTLRTVQAKKEGGLASVPASSTAGGWLLAECAPALLSASLAGHCGH